jgi:D-alanine-D-alanine ligase
MEKPKKNVALIFGGRSPEHEVSIITAHQVLAALNRRYGLILIYITKTGEWLTSDKFLELDTFTSGNLPNGSSSDKVIVELGLKPKFLAGRRGFGRLQRNKPMPIDIVFPVMHGAHGEDGTLQGLLELMNIPYVGAGVLGSATGMDKIIMKAVLSEGNLPIVSYLWFTKKEWEANPEEIIKKVEQDLAYPVFVKPANSGSSIGVSQAQNQDDLKSALDLASQYDLRVIVEEGLEDAIEINCSVMGNYDLTASVCEQPMSAGTFLSFDDKYVHEESKASGMAGADRTIPAPISAELTIKIQELAKRAFRALDCRGVARIDFFVGKNEKPFVNEINTIPGSFSFYLWERDNIDFPQLVDRLIELAFEVYKDKNSVTYSYAANLLNRLTLDSGKLKTGSGVKSITSD